MKLFVASRCCWLLAIVLFLIIVDGEVIDVIGQRVAWWRGTATDDDRTVFEGEE